MVMGTTGIKDTHTASLYELAFTATRSVSGKCCEVKQRRARLVAGWVTQALEQGQLGSCAHAGYHRYYIILSRILGDPVRGGVWQNMKIDIMKRHTFINKMIEDNIID